MLITPNKQLILPGHQYPGGGGSAEVNKTGAYFDCGIRDGVQTGLVTAADVYTASVSKLVIAMRLRIDIGADISYGIIMMSNAYHFWIQCYEDMNFVWDFRNSAGTSTAMIQLVTGSTAWKHNQWWNFILAVDLSTATPAAQLYVDDADASGDPSYDENLVGSETIDCTGHMGIMNYDSLYDGAVAGGLQFLGMWTGIYPDFSVAATRHEIFNSDNTCRLLSEYGADGSNISFGTPDLMFYNDYDTFDTNRGSKGDLFAKEGTLLPGDGTYTVPAPIDFGTGSGWMNLGSDLSGATDGDFFVLALRFRKRAVSDVGTLVDFGKVKVYLGTQTNPGDQLMVSVTDTSGTPQTISWYSGASFGLGAGSVRWWGFVLVYDRTSNANTHMWQDGSDRSSSKGSTLASAIDFTSGEFTIGADQSGANKFPGDIGMIALWLDPATTPANDGSDLWRMQEQIYGYPFPIERYGSAGANFYIGQPELFLMNPASSFNTNRGSAGGTFTVNGSLADVSPYY